MQRVAIVATASGCGKTTVGRALAAILGVPFVELDAIHWQAGWRELDAAELRRPRSSRSWRGDAWVGRRLLPRQARRPRPRGGGHGRLARPAAPGLAPAPRRADAAPRRRSARSCGTGTASRSANAPRRLVDSLVPLRRCANERPRRHRYPRELARYRVARLRSPAEVDAFLRSAREARAELRNPGRRAEPEPDRRQDDVEDDHRDAERAQPDRPSSGRGTQPFSARSRRTPRASGPYLAFGPLTSSRLAAPAHAR